MRPGGRGRLSRTDSEERAGHELRGDGPGEAARQESARRRSRPVAPAAAPEWAFLGTKILEPFGPSGPRWVPASAGLVCAVLLAWMFVVTAKSAMSAVAGTPADIDVATTVAAGRTAELTSLMWTVSLLGNTPVAWACSIAFVLGLVVWGYRAQAALVVITVGGGNALSALIKQVLERPRPQGIESLIASPHSFSMPSGHVVYATLVAALVLFAVVTSRRMTASTKSVLSGMALTWMMLMGVSRVYLGVHWASDAVAGWLLGAAWACACLGAWVSWRRGVEPEVHTPAFESRSRRALAATTVAVVALVVWLSAIATPLVAASS